MVEKEDRKIKIEDMIELCLIKDENSPSGYSLGKYEDRVGLNGFYLKAKKGSLCERVENTFCGKFKLEFDHENYRQEARLQLWLSINKYYEKLGYDDSRKGDGLIFQNCKYKAMDMAKLAKSNVSICDRSTGKYHINKIESFEQKFIEESDKIKNQKDERYLCEMYNAIFVEENETTSEFKKWLNKNRSYILTKKQIDYLDGEVIINDMSGQWRINKSIAKRVEECYANDKFRTEKVNKLNKKLKNVTYLLDFKDEEDLLERLIKTSHKKNDDVLVKLFEYLKKDQCILLTKIISEEYKDVNDKKFFYDVIDILVKEEKYINDLIESVKKEGEIPWD